MLPPQKKFGKGFKRRLKPQKFNAERSPFLSRKDRSALSIHLAEWSSVVTETMAQHNSLSHFSGAERLSPGSQKVGTEG
jgi:hypothetical protein